MQKKLVRSYVLRWIVQLWFIPTLSIAVSYVYLRYGAAPSCADGLLAVGVWKIRPSVLQKPPNELKLHVIL